MTHSSRLPRALELADPPAGGAQLSERQAQLGVSADAPDKRP